MGDPDQIRNLGTVSRQWLESVGIRTIEDLRRIGSVAAYALVRQAEPRVSLNLLWALEASLRDCDWRDLTPADKAALKASLAKLTN